MNGKKQVDFQGKMRITPYDWGPAVDQLLIKGIGLVVEPENLVITQTSQVSGFDGQSAVHQIKNESRQIVKIHPDPAEDGVYRVDLRVDPETGGALNFNFDSGFSEWRDPCHMEICFKKEKICFSVTDTCLPDLDPFTWGKWQDGQGDYYDYALYSPEQKTDRMVVWLHGGGEGRSGAGDPRIPLAAAKAAALAQEDFQQAVGPAFILVPQCPTLWLDNGHLREDWMETIDSHSLYTHSLHRFIEHMKTRTGSSQVILAGCSNGGFMVMNMALNYPHAYRGYLAICQGLIDRAVTDEDIDVLKTVPLYLVYCAQDPVLPPKRFSIPTIARLQQAGARDLEVCSCEKLQDRTGQWKNSQGNPWEYNGHWAWIDFFNDDCISAGSIPAWKWMASHFENA